jgi:hypothetical protein
MYRLFGVKDSAAHCIAVASGFSVALELLKVLNIYIYIFGL